MSAHEHGRAEYTCYLFFEAPHAVSDLCRVMILENLMRWGWDLLVGRGVNVGARLIQARSPVQTRNEYVRCPCPCPMLSVLSEAGLTEMVVEQAFSLTR